MGNMIFMHIIVLDTTCVVVTAILPCIKKSVDYNHSITIVDHSATNATPMLGVA